MIHDHDKSICKWSVQIDGYCPFEEMLNRFINSHVEKKIRCKSKECLYLILKETGAKDEKEFVEKNYPEFMKPKGPLLAHELLSNINIDEVLHDFSVASIPKKNQKNLFVNGPFFHIPFDMRDFEKAVTSDFRDLNLNELHEKKFKSFGCVLNTDTWDSAQGGEHWVCVFGTLEKTNKCNIEYFNSSGNGLSSFKEIKKWIKKKQDEFKNLEITFEEIVDYPIQGEDSVCCGAYCLLYIKSRLEGKEKNYFQKFKINDNFVDNFRKYLFS